MRNFNGIQLALRRLGAPRAFGAVPRNGAVLKPLPPSAGHADDVANVLDFAAFGEDDEGFMLDDGFWGSGNSLEQALGIDPDEDLVTAADVATDSGGRAGPDAPATTAASVAPAELPATEAQQAASARQAAEMFNEAVSTRDAWAQEASTASAAANAAAACGDVSSFQQAAAAAKEAQAQAAAADAFAAQMAAQLKAASPQTAASPLVDAAQRQALMLPGAIGANGAGGAGGVSLTKLAIGAGIGYFVWGRKGALIGLAAAWWMGKKGISAEELAARAEEAAGAALTGHTGYRR